VEFRVLGPLEVIDRDEHLVLGGHRQRMVLAVLVLNANQVVSTDRLINDVWGDEPPSTARKSLQVYISRLRSLLGPDRIEPQRPGYVLRLEPDELDADHFSDLVGRARACMDSDPVAAAGLLHEALGLWHGATLADLDTEPAFRPDITRLDEQRLAAVEDRIEIDLRLGRHGEVIGELESLIARHPLRERLRGLLMVALYQSGRQADALRAYQDIRRLLAEELGLEPSEDLQDLESRILGHDPSLEPLQQAPPTTAGDTTNPYKGLMAFTEADAADFFGREALVSEMLDRLDAGRFLAVIGPSGSGKSSAVRAGLVPALRRGALDGSAGWTIATMLPGAHPFAEFEAALVRADPGSTQLGVAFRGDDLDLLRAVLRVVPDDGGLLLLIDQFEELFLLVKDEAVRRRFISNLVEAVEDPHSGLRVVVTLRADFFDQPLQYPELAGLIDRGQITVPPLDPLGLSRAAVRPAARVGVDLEPDLAGALVADVAHRPGALPMFQYTLTELFAQREGPVLTADAYRAFGGMEGALQARAEEIFASLDPAAQDVARQVFLRLVAVTESGEEVRRRVRRPELESLEAGTVAEVLERFGTHRLLTFDRDAASGEPTVEVAHEALLTRWGRLAGWIDTGRDDLRVHRAFTAEADAWVASGRHADYLATGARLGLFEEWSRTTAVQLAPTEHDYLTASLERRAAEAQQETDRLARERQLEQRSRTRLRALVAILAVATLVAGVLAVIAVASQREADEQRDAAVAAEAEAVANREEAEQQRTAAVLSAAETLAHGLSYASIANLVEDPQRSLLLALHAVDIMGRMDEPIPTETVEALHWAFQETGGIYPLVDGPAAAVASPMGSRGVYILPIDELVAIAHGQVTRELTAAECAEFFREQRCPQLPDAMPGPLVEAEPLQPTSLEGTTVAVDAPYNELQWVAFDKEAAVLTEQTGIVAVPAEALAWEFASWLQAIEWPLPDVTVINQPANVPGLAEEGILIDLSRYLDVAELEQTTSPYLVDLGSVGADGSWPSADGALYAPTIALSNKSLIWYPDPEFGTAGYKAPEDWDDLLALSDQLLADGRSPWCWGEESLSADGWPATDWVEDLVLRSAGPQAYDEWVSGARPFSDPEIRAAFEMLGELVFTDGYLYRGRQGALEQYPWRAITDMVWDPPECWLFHYASFGAEDVGSAAATFPTPTVSERGSTGVIGGGDMIVVHADRPEVREYVRHVLGPDYGYAFAAENPSFLSARQDFDLDGYTIDGEPNVVVRPAAAALQVALANDTFRFDGSDLMPPEVGQRVFWDAMIDYIAYGPDNLDELLARIDAAWPRN
jgi:DNA-binding SARP family transcriptional activator